jgi:hypothetical protein
MDQLAWNLSDPFGPLLPNPNTFQVPPAEVPDYHPLKGPMTTLSLQGLAGTGPLHWRGERTAGLDPGGDPFDTRAALLQFNPPFVSLLGRETELDAEEFGALADFLLSIRYPPSPIRALDDGLNPSEAAGKALFDTFAVFPSPAGPKTCEQCHQPAEVGADGVLGDQARPQMFKIPQLRNLYQKVGRFDVPGDQIRGFGFQHDGALGTILQYLESDFFTIPTHADRVDLEAFMFAFGTGLPPAVGQQASVSPASVGDASVQERIDFLIGRTLVGDCDLVVKGAVAGEARGWLHVGSGEFQPDRAGEPVISTAALRSLAGLAGQEQVYTCVPLGFGSRLGLDRDEDTFYDRDELDAGSDPADPASVPATCPTATDDDGDAVCNALDNCSAVPNGDQCDSDGDGYGSACDADYDGDGVTGIADFLTLAVEFPSSVPPGDPDLDHNCDGVIGIADFLLFSSEFGGPPGPSGLACAGTVPCP